MRKVNLNLENYRFQSLNGISNKSETERGPERSCRIHTDKGVNQHSKDVTQAQQKGPASPTVTLT